MNIIPTDTPLIKTPLMGLCSCGMRKSVDPLSTSEEIKQKENLSRGSVEEIKTNGSYENICKKCGHNECEIQDLGLQSGGESNVYIFKCKKCGAVERHKDGYR